MKSGLFAKPRLMGILNLTPDSFSDGGAYQDTAAAVAQAEKMVSAGADLIDIGGESTRPGSQRVEAAEQKRRILDVVAAVHQTLPDTTISIDTTLSEVAAAALDAGGSMLNDVSAGRDDPAMLELAARRKVPICLMHIQGEPMTMQDDPQYGDVVKEVADFLRERSEAALSRGVSREQIVLDPGIGFGKTDEHNLQLLAGLKHIVALGYPVLLGVSRKRFINALHSSPNPSDRVAGSCAATVIGAQAGVRIFRVHDVFEHKQALAVALAVQSE